MPSCQEVRWIRKHRRENPVLCHLASLASKEESSVLWKHSKDKHNGRVPHFCMSVTGQFTKDARLRQVPDAVMINKEGKENVMNNKNDSNVYKQRFVNLFSNRAFLVLYHCWGQLFTYQGINFLETHLGSRGEFLKSLYLES